jgi:hypothetical protein
LTAISNQTSEQIASSSRALAKVIERFERRLVERPASKCRAPDCPNEVPPPESPGRPRRSCSAKCAREIVVLRMRAQRAAAKAAR